MFRSIFVSIVLLGTVGADLALAQPAPLSLLTADPPLAQRIKPSSDQVTFAVGKDTAAPDISVTIKAGKDGYPGITLSPPGKVWDLAAFGHIEARVTNTGSKQLGLTLRVDGDDDWRKDPWNGENVYLKPGATGTVRVRFGYSWGKPGYPVKPAAIARVLLFAGKVDAEQSFKIESLQAGGSPGEKPPVDPNTIRVKPVNGVILGPGQNIEAAKQVAEKNAKAAVEVQSGSPALRVTFPAGAKGDQSAALKPAIGRWDLGNWLQVAVKVRNAGQTPVTPRLRLESSGGQSDWAAAVSPLATGQTQEIIIPFTPAKQWNGGNETCLRSDAVTAVTISAVAADAERVLLVDSIVAGMPPAPQLPTWLGKRPPVAGDWKMTFDEEFDGNTIDATKWNILGENYWDKQSHFSKDNVILGGGLVRLRFEKKRGHQNDDPKHQRVTDYATGYLDTYGKWTQRYGYFESRVKLPTAPGLWPAFWMMPDRGVDVGPQWKRQDTGNGGMEFDIMEHLTRWGPNRMNIAMHWDGYGKEHKSRGTDRVYFQPDKDGFVAFGLLWEPGKLVWYVNGAEAARWENERVATVPGILMFTLPMGGWDNSPLEDAKLPDDFIIDYARCWQRRDLASEPKGR